MSFSMVGASPGTRFRLQGIRRMRSKKSFYRQIHDLITGQIDLEGKLNTQGGALAEVRSSHRRLAKYSEALERRWYVRLGFFLDRIWKGLNRPLTFGRR